MPFQIRCKKGKKGSAGGITSQAFADIEQQENISNKFFKTIGCGERSNAAPASRGGGGGGAVFNVLPQNSPKSSSNSGAVLSRDSVTGVFERPGRNQRKSDYPSVILVDPANPKNEVRRGDISDDFLALGGKGDSGDPQYGYATGTEIETGSGPRGPSRNLPDVQDHQASNEVRRGDISDDFLALGGKGDSGDPQYGYATGTEIETGDTNAEGDDDHPMITVTNCDLDTKYKDYIADYVGENLDIEDVSGSLRPMIKHLNETDGQGWRLDLITAGDFNTEKAIPGTTFVFAPEGQNLKYAIFKSKSAQR
ncbi:unnamed protein product [Calicophoron daubneyi]|uniref:Uncharacterized protein n=1 Tax=Calicophoron daubneyi TaxID=300641 RepID=A0AAV2TRB9_CALDB